MRLSICSFMRMFEMWFFTVFGLMCSSPATETDPVFNARKGYYRESSVRALATPGRGPPMAIIAAEHTAQLSAAQSDDVFSKAEEHELLFQDVEIRYPRAGRAAAGGHRCPLLHDHDGGWHRHRHALGRRATQYAALEGQLPATISAAPVAVATRWPP